MLDGRALFQMFQVQEQFRGPSDIADVYQGPHPAACWATCYHASPTLAPIPRNLALGVLPCRGTEEQLGEGRPDKLDFLWPSSPVQLAGMLCRVAAHSQGPRAARDAGTSHLESWHRR